MLSFKPSSLLVFVNFVPSIRVSVLTHLAAEFGLSACQGFAASLTEQYVVGCLYH